MRSRSQLLLHSGILICVLITAAALLSSWPWVWAPAVLAAILFAIAHSFALIERRALRERKMQEMEADERSMALLAGQERVATRSGLTLVLGLIAIAIVFAGMLMGWTFVAIGSLVVFSMLAFIGMPFWLAAVEEEVETERERLTGEVRSIH